MSTPYVTTQMMKDAPLGISWDTIPEVDATPEAQAAAQADIAQRATSMVDSFCQQPLRATTDAETVYGPDSRLTIEANGNAHVLLSRFPVISVQDVSVAGAVQWPRSFQSVPSGYYDFDQPIMPVAGSTAIGSDAVGGQGLFVAPGYISWGLGRRGYIVKVTYTNGWPHGSLTAAATAAATTVTVDDTTGFAGAIATIYDGPNTETVTVATASTTGGPGTLTLSALQSSHPAGVMISCLPAVVQQATLMFCAHIALERGAMALTVQSMPGAEEHGAAPDFATEAEVMLHPFRRVI